MKSASVRTMYHLKRTLFEKKKTFTVPMALSQYSHFILRSFWKCVFVESALMGVVHRITELLKRRIGTVLNLSLVYATLVMSTTTLTKTKKKVNARYLL